MFLIAVTILSVCFARFNAGCGFIGMVTGVLEKYIKHNGDRGLSITSSARTVFRLVLVAVHRAKLTAGERLRLQQQHNKAR